MSAHPKVVSMAKWLMVCHDHRNRADTKDLTTSSKFSGSCVLTLQTLPFAHLILSHLQEQPKEELEKEREDAPLITGWFHRLTPWQLTWQLHFLFLSFLILPLSQNQIVLAITGLMIDMSGNCVSDTTTARWILALSLSGDLGIRKRPVARKGAGMYTVLAWSG